MPPLSVFVDTSALYAHLVRNDEDHDRVTIRALLAGRRPLLTTSYVVVETVAAAPASHRLGAGP